MSAAQMLKPCQWHRLTKSKELPLPCTLTAEAGSTICLQHHNELSLQVLEHCTPKCSWVVYWVAGSKLQRRCGAGEIAATMARRHPEGKIEQSLERTALELRVNGRVVAMVRRLEDVK